MRETYYCIEFSKKKINKISMHHNQFFRVLDGKKIVAEATSLT